MIPNPFEITWRAYSGVSPRHQFVSRSTHPGSKPNKAAKARAAHKKQKRHCKRCPEMRGQRVKGRNRK